MKSSDAEFLARVRGLPPLERASAIAHRAYVLTAARAEWPLRVPDDWEELAPEARDFNIQSSITWVNSKQLLDEWLRAIEEAKTTSPQPDPP